MVVEAALLAVKVAITNGFSPALKPGEYCVDAEWSILHCCSPGGGRFSVVKESAGKMNYVTGKHGLTISVAPEYAWDYRVRHAGLGSAKDGIIRNDWTIVRGEWRPIANGDARKAKD